jgi:hypothetical protein
MEVNSTQDMVNLMLKSCNNNPYTGKLSKEENIKASIDLANLCLNFAKDGHRDEAMHFSESQWIEVIKQLEDIYAAKEN